jgi:hypothetical protein
MAMSTVAIHVFGDVPSSPLVGVLEVRVLEIPGHTFYSFYIHNHIFQEMSVLEILLIRIWHKMIMQDSINNWRTTTLILTTVLFPAAGIWFIGISSQKFHVNLLKRRILVSNSFEPI